MGTTHYGHCPLQLLSDCISQVASDKLLFGVLSELYQRLYLTLRIMIFAPLSPQNHADSSLGPAGGSLSQPFCGNSLISWTWKNISLLMSIFTCANVIFVITAFTQAYVIGKRETDLLGVICCGMKDQKVNSLSQEAFTDNTCYIYRLEEFWGFIITYCNIWWAAQKPIFFLCVWNYIAKMHSEQSE